MFLFYSNVFQITAFSQGCADNNLDTSSHVQLLISYFLTVFFCKGKGLTIYLCVRVHVSKGATRSGMLPENCFLFFIISVTRFCEVGRVA
jgi:hypothetical protein